MENVRVFQEVCSRRSHYVKWLGIFTKYVHKRVSMEFQEARSRRDHCLLRRAEGEAQHVLISVQLDFSTIQHSQGIQMPNLSTSSNLLTSVCSQRCGRTF